MLIFICFIIKQYFVHSILLRIIKVYVYMLIIGRILEENHIYIITNLFHAVIEI